MLAIREWPHDPSYPLCLSSLETAKHLYKDCPFTTTVWNTLHQEEDAHTPGRDGQIFPTISE
jgi:hypothetical protein